jgi:PilZ domain
MAEENVNPKNRRAFMRRRPRGKVKVTCYKGNLDLGQNIALGIADVSESGVLLLLKVHLEKGQDVTMMIEGREHMRPVKVHGKVVWCVPMDKDVHRVGVQLDGYLRYQEMMKIT